MRQNANGTYDIEATTESTVAYVEYKHSRRAYCIPTITQLLCCINFWITTIAYIIMTMRVFMRNIAGGDNRLQ